MSARLVRASITPFDAAGRETVEADRIPFDFNPETLTLKTSAGVARDKARQGRQQVQQAGATSATLNFEAVFDATRPRDGDGGRPAAEEALDVRLRTRPLALLVQAPEGETGESGGDEQPAPRRVQFRWGSIVFNGLITTYQETFDFFSPGGVPLRSKVQITLTEQEFRYEVDSAERARARAAAGGGFGASSGFSASFSAGFSASFSAGFSGGLSLDAELGIGVNAGLSAGAGMALSAGAAVDLFGPAALGTGGAAVGRSGLGASLAAGSPTTSGQVAPGPWAPEGPAPGSQAAALASVVLAQRASGAALAAPGTPVSAKVLPLRGSPPPALPRGPGGSVTAPLRRAVAAPAPTGAPAPRWAALGVAAPALPAAHAPRAGCACPCCGGG